MRHDDLERAFARREAGAYETAYRWHGARMQATAVRILHDGDAAAECVHDVFLHLWRRQNAYSCARGSLEAFLVACVRNQALTRLRDLRRRHNAVSKLNVEATYELDLDPVERQKVQRALSQLTRAQSDVVRLAYYGGMTLTEVASQLEIPVGTVKGRLSTALQSLRRSLVTGEMNGR